MSVSVVPTPLVTTPPIIYGFNYNVQSFQLNTQITFNVILVDERGTPLQVRQVSISGADYAAWGNNDSYIETYICNALGLTALNPLSVAQVPVEVDVPAEVETPVEVPAQVPTEVEVPAEVEVPVEPSA